MKNKIPIIFNLVLIILLMIIKPLGVYSKNSGYTKTDFMKGSKEDLELQIHNRSKNINLAKTHNIRIKIPTLSLFVTNDPTSSFTIELFEIDGSERKFLNSQNVTITKHNIARVISIDAGYFSSTSKILEFDIYNSNKEYINTYTTTINANNLDKQSKNLEQSIAAADCDNSSFGECQIKYLLNRVVFEAKPQTQATTRVLKGENGFYKVTVPVNKRNFKLLGSKFNRKKGKKNNSDDDDDTSIAPPPDLSAAFYLTAKAGDGESPSIKIEPGLLTEDLVDGALEYDGSDLYFTRNGSRTVIGEKGEKGDTGPSGPAGIQGLQGPQGPQGPIGSFMNGSTVNGILAFGSNGILQNPILNGTALFKLNGIAKFNGDFALANKSSAPAAAEGFGKLFVNGNTLFFIDNGGTQVNLLTGGLSGPAKGPDGTIQFYTSGVFNGDSTNFFWDNTNKRLGIGDNSPVAALDVGGGTANFINGVGDIIVSDDIEVDDDAFIAGTVTALNLNGTTVNTTNIIASATINGATVVSDNATIHTNLTTNAINGVTMDLDFSNGSIIFSNQEGVLSQDNINLFWDRQNNRLGLGRDDPNELLTVNGTISLFNQSSAPNNLEGFGKLFVNGNILYFLDNGDNFHDLLTTNAETLDGLDSTDYLRSNTGDSFTGANTLTIAAAATFDVDGTSRFDGTTFDVNSSNVSISDTNITLDGGSTTFTQSSGAISLVPNGGSDLNINLSGAGDLVVNTNDLFVDTSAGAIGIGTNSPTHSIDLRATGLGSDDADIRLSSENGAVWVMGIDNSEKSRFKISNGSALDVNTAFTITRNGNVGINNNTPNESLTVNGSFSLEETAVVPGNTSGFGKLYVDSTTSNLYFMDAAGVPHDILMTNGTTQVSEWTDAGSLLRPTDNSGEQTIITGGTSTFSADIILLNGGGAIFNEQSNDHDFRIESDDDMNAFFLEGADGNIGIGTNTPATFELQVLGNAGPNTDSAHTLGSNAVRWSNTYSDTFTGTTGAITTLNSTTGNITTVNSTTVNATNFDGSYTLGSVLFSNAGGVIIQDNTNFFWNDTTNRLGLATNSPDSRLHIVGQIKIVDGNENNGYVLVSDANGLASWQASSAVPAGNADTLDSVDSTQFLRSDTSDSFTGVNTLTIAAAASLDIDGGLSIADTNISFDGASTTFTQTTGAFTFAPAAGTNFNVNLATTGDFAVNTNHLYVDTSASNVGIGTTSPQTKLEVSSVIRSTPTDAPGACGASSEGGMYYDDSMSEPCFCNGTNWVQFDGGGVCT